MGAVALASAPSPQEAESWNTGKTGLFCSLLFQSQPCVAIKVKDWHVTLNCWPKLLHQCLGKGLPVVLQGLYPSHREPTTLLIHTAYRTWKKKLKFWCTSSVLHVPVVIHHFALLLFNLDNSSGKWSHGLLEIRCCRFA